MVVSLMVLQSWAFPVPFIVVANHHPAPHGQATDRARLLYNFVRWLRFDKTDCSVDVIEGKQRTCVQRGLDTVHQNRISLYNLDKSTFHVVLCYLQLFTKIID